MAGEEHGLWASSIRKGGNAVEQNFTFLLGFRRWASSIRPLKPLRCDSTSVGGPKQLFTFEARVNGFRRRCLRPISVARNKMVEKERTD
jgi:hypothetical protein